MIFDFHTYEEFIVSLVLRENERSDQPEVKLEMYFHLKKEWATVSFQMPKICWNISSLRVQARQTKSLQIKDEKI